MNECAYEPVSDLQDSSLLLNEQVSIGLAVFCLPWLRWKHPEWERPIKVSLIWPFLYVIATVFITIVPMIASPVETGNFNWFCGRLKHPLR